MTEMELIEAADKLYIFQPSPRRIKKRVVEKAFECGKKEAFKLLKEKINEDI